jgi:hypothetical protein
VGAGGTHRTLDEHCPSALPSANSDVPTNSCPFSFNHHEYDMNPIDLLYSPFAPLYLIAAVGCSYIIISAFKELSV